MLESRPLGATGLVVSRLGFGGAALGIQNYLVDERRDEDAVQARARDALAAAVAAGITIFDTAPGYGFGRAERLFGEVLPPHRDRIVLATKVKVEPGTGPDDWTRSVAESLDRLNADRVDLLQLHGTSWPDGLAAWVLERGVLDWLETIKARGWTRATGITAEVPSGGLERLIDSRRLDVLQMAYSVIYQGACDHQRAPFGPIPRARDLGMGILTMRAATSGVLQKLLHAEFPDLEPARVTRLALRFVLSTPQVDSALVGMRTPDEVRANVALAGDATARMDVAGLHDFFDGRPREAPPGGFPRSQPPQTTGR
jgi:aryl-alcohol dehydrogenase-like predicted oxidoreductase